MARNWKWVSRDLARGFPTLLCPGVEVDVASGVVWKSAGPVALTSLERDLFRVLLGSPNQLVATDEIVTELYGRIDLEHGRNRLKTLVAQVRRKLGKAAQRLRTARGIGLVLYTANAVDPKLVRSAAARAHLR